MSRTIAAIVLVLSLGSAAPAVGRIVGQTEPASSLQPGRFAALPAVERQQWATYWKRSQSLRSANMRALTSERLQLQGSFPAPPPVGSAESAPLDRAPAWYKTREARQIADNIVSFQTPAGGWSKNQDRSAPPRQLGQSYVSGLAASGSTQRNPVSSESEWAYAGTIDNGATVTELRFLALVQNAFPDQDGDAYRAAFLRGVRYLLNAQYPSGGWPQIYPLQGGYHDALTYNDDAMAGVVDLLTDVAARKGEYAFIPQELAAESRAAVCRAITVIVNSQVIVAGLRTGWGQQHDPITLKPVGARNFEPASISSAETATILRLLMRLPEPSSRIVAAVHQGIGWLRSVPLHNVQWTKVSDSEGRRLVPKAGAGPLWSRFYDLQTMRPIFGDRDKRIHDDVNDLSLERRNGYSWFGTWPAAAIKAYDKWATAHPPKSGSRTR